MNFFNIFSRKKNKNIAVITTKKSSIKSATFNEVSDLKKQLLSKFRKQKVDIKGELEIPLLVILSYVEGLQFKIVKKEDQTEPSEALHSVAFINSFDLLDFFTFAVKDMLQFGASAFKVIPDENKGILKFEKMLMKNGVRPVLVNQNATFPQIDYFQYKNERFFEDVFLIKDLSKNSTNRVSEWFPRIDKSIQERLTNLVNSMLLAANGVPVGILSKKKTDNLLSNPDTKLELDKDILEGFGMQDQKILVLPEPYDFHDTQNDPRTLQFFEQYQELIDNVWRLYGLDPVIMQDGKYSNKQEAINNFIETTFIPMVNRVTKFISNVIFSYYPTEGLRYELAVDYSQIAPIKAKQQQLEMQRAENSRENVKVGIITIEEARQEQGIE